MEIPFVGLTTTNHKTKLGENFEIFVDADPNCCTNILVDKYVDGLYRPWTICGAYGDNLRTSRQTKSI